MILGTRIASATFVPWSYATSVPTVAGRPGVGGTVAGYPGAVHGHKGPLCTDPGENGMSNFLTTP